MTILEVVCTAPIKGNTTVVIKGDGSELSNGIGILDTSGTPHKVISVGMTSGQSDNERTTAMLVEGTFDSEFAYV